MIDEFISFKLEIKEICRAAKKERIKSTLTPKVAKRYEQSLKCIQLEHPTLVEEYVKTYRYPSESARDSRLLKIQAFRMGEESKNKIMTMKGWLDYVNGKRVNNYDLLDDFQRDYRLVKNNGSDKTRYSYKVEVCNGEEVTTYMGIRKFKKWDGRTSTES